MSKFDATRARASVGGPAMSTHKKYLLTACDHIDALEARIGKLEAVRVAAVKLRYGPTKEHTALDDALAACDDVEVSP